MLQPKFKAGDRVRHIGGHAMDTAIIVDAKRVRPLFRLTTGFVYEVKLNEYDKGSRTDWVPEDSLELDAPVYKTFEVVTTVSAVNAEKALAAARNGTGMLAVREV